MARDEVPLWLRVVLWRWSYPTDERAWQACVEALTVRNDGKRQPRKRAIAQARVAWLVSDRYEQSEIAERTGLGLRSVERYVAELKDFYGTRRRRNGGPPERNGEP